MLQDNILKAWFNFVKSVVPPEWTVTFADQKDDAPRPPKPYITLKIISGPKPKMLRDTKQFIEGEDNAFLVGLRAYSLSIQAYGADFNDALGDIITMLDDDDARDTLRAADIGSINKGGIIDISKRLPTGFESRASLDILFNSSNTKETGIGTIETVVVTGEMETENGTIITTNQTINQE